MSKPNWIDEAGHQPGPLGTAGLGLLVGAFFALCTWCMGGMLMRVGAEPGEGPVAYLVTVLLGVALLFCARWWNNRPTLAPADVSLVEAYAWNSAGAAVLSLDGRAAAQLTYGQVRRAARAHVAFQRREEDASKRRQNHLAMDSMLNRYNGEA